MWPYANLLSYWTLKGIERDCFVFIFVTVFSCMFIGKLTELQQTSPNPESCLNSVSHNIE